MVNVLSVTARLSSSAPVSLRTAVAEYVTVSPTAAARSTSSCVLFACKILSAVEAQYSSSSSEDTVRPVYCPQCHIIRSRYVLKIKFLFSASAQPQRQHAGKHRAEPSFCCIQCRYFPFFVFVTHPAYLFLFDIKMFNTKMPLLDQILSYCIPKKQKK